MTKLDIVSIGNIDCVYHNGEYIPLEEYKELKDQEFRDMCDRLDAIYEAGLEDQIIPDREIVYKS